MQLARATASCLRLALFAGLVGWVGLAGPAPTNAEDDKAPRYTPRCLRFARYVTRLVDRNDVQGLRDIERGVDPDPWLASWVLVAQGNVEAARAFVKAHPHSELEHLPKQLERWIESPPPKALLDQVVALDSGMDSKVLKFEDTLRESEALIAGSARFPKALALLRSGTAALRLAQLPEAAKRLEAAEKAAADLGWLWGQDRAQHARGQLELRQDQPRKALETLRAVVNRREQLSWQRALAYAYVDLAAVHGAINDYRAVIALTVRAPKLLRVEFHWRAVFAMHMNMGLAHARLGDLAGALHQFEEATSLGDAVERAPFRARARIHVAWILARLGRFEDAERNRKEAAAWAAKCPTSEYSDEVEAFTGGLDALRAQATGSGDDWEAAFARHGEARKRFESANEHDLAAKALLAQATVRAWQGRFDEALPILRRATRALESLKLEHDAIEARLLEGWIRLKQDRPAEAGSAFANALARAEAIEARHPQAVALHGRAAARAAGLEGLDTKQRAVALAAVLDDVESAVRIQALLASGLAEEQVASAREAFEVTPLGQDEAARSGLLELGLVTARDLGDSARLFRLMESARALGFIEAHAGMAKLRAAGAADLQSPEEVVARREEALARFSLEKALRRRDHRRTREARLKLKEAMAVTAGVLEKAQRRAKARANAVYPRPVRVAEVQAALGKHDTLLNFAVFDGAVHALVVKQQGAPSLRILGPLEPVTAALDAMHGDIEEHGKTSAGAFASLRSLLVEPLGSAVRTKRLLVSPDGVLHGVPFAALIPTCEVTQVPSASAWLAIRGEDRAPGAAVVGVGGPTYASGRGLSPLPGAAAELAALPGTAATRLTGNEATLRALTGALPKEARLRLLHVACHGIADEEHPSASSLELAADGEHTGSWRAQDIMLANIPADLVVLSACRTGVGRSYRGEGLLGLPRAFLIAGAERVVASLWKVDDEATQALMGYFYAALGSGSSPAAALCKAQAKVRAEAKWAHPYYWAAWVIWGRPG